MILGERVGAPLLAVILALAIASCGGSGGSSSTTASTPVPGDADAPIPDDAVAVVRRAAEAGVPKDRVESQIAQDAARAGKDAPSPGSSGYSKAQDTAMSEVLLRYWTEGEALKRNITVTIDEIDNQLQAEKDAQFATEADYQRFLRENHLTEQDARDQVRTRLLGDQISQEVAQGGSELAQQTALENFVKHFDTYWRARTTCAEDYVMYYCANGPPLSEAPTEKTKP